MLITEIKKLDNSLNRKMNLLAAELGLTGKQFVVLGYILKNSKKFEVSQGDVEKFFNLRKSSVSSIITNLEKLNYIKRSATSSDARKKILVPTDKAFDIERKVKENERRFEKNLFKEFKEEDILNCENLLIEINKKLNELYLK